MTLTIHKEEDDQRQLKLKVEVSEDRVDKAMHAKARQLAREIRFPGFRKGKVPYGVVLQRIGRDTVRAEAVEDMVQDIFVETLDQIEVEPYAQPNLDDMHLEPLVLEFTVPLEPTVTLGNYREMRKEIEPIEVTEEAVDEAIEQVQAEHAVIEPVDRPIEAGDMVTVGGYGLLLPVDDDADDTNEEEAESDEDEEEPFEDNEEYLFDRDHLDLLMDANKLFPGTPFVENLLGLSVGDETDFELTFPEDFEDEDIAGRQAAFELSIMEVKSRELPPIDDDLAKLAGDYETVAELREELQKQLQSQAEDQGKEALIDEAIHEMLEDAVIVYPPAALENELDEMVENFKSQVKRSNWDFDDYLKIQGSTEESLRDDFRDSAEHRLAHRLILRQFMLDEKLKVNIEDVSALVDERVDRYENEELRNQMREFYMKGTGFDMISSEVLSNKVYDRLVAIYSGEAPDLDQLEEEELQANRSEEE